MFKSKHVYVIQNYFKHYLNRSIWPIVRTDLGVMAMSSSSSCRAGSTDIPDPLSPLFPIVHRLRQVFWTTSCILT